MKISGLFEKCRDKPPKEWSNIIKSTGEKKTGIYSHVIRLLNNERKAEIWFESLKNRVESELKNIKKKNELNTGDTIGNYRIIRKINDGGMAGIYQAERIQNQGKTSVAIKIMTTSGSNCRMKHKFINEQQILLRLNHPNIGKIYDKGISSEGGHYTVLEYIEGLPIDSYCERNNLDLYSRLKLFLQVCDAVQIAHENSIIHNDIKPGNILVKNDNQVKLIDFGISEIREKREPGDLKKTGFSGTIGYASPEQLEGKQPSAASDIYQMGKVLYKIVCGISNESFPHLKNESESGAGILVFAKLIKEKYDISPSLTTIKILLTTINKAMSLNADYRYHTPDSFKSKINTLLNSF